MIDKYILEEIENSDNHFMVSQVDELDEDGDPLFLTMIAEFYEQKDAQEYIDFKNNPKPTVDEVIEFLTRYKTSPYFRDKHTEFDEVIDMLMELKK